MKLSEATTSELFEYIAQLEQIKQYALELCYSLPSGAYPDDEIGNACELLAETIRALDTPLRLNERRLTMETFVLRWTKDNLPFWQGVDDGEKIEINAVANVINKHTVLKRAIRYEHTLDGGDKCLKAKQGMRCEICALLTAEEEDDE